MARCSTPTSARHRSPCRTAAGCWACSATSDLKLVRQEIAIATEVPMRRKDGTVFYADISAAQVTMQNRRWLLGVFRDITARKQAEEALQQSEERYRLLFESNPLPMWFYDLDAPRSLAWNEAPVKPSGYPREKFLGMTIKQTPPPEDIPALLMF